MSYRPGPETGEYAPSVVSDGGGTITVGGASSTLIWTKWPRDKRGVSLVRLQGILVADSVSTPSGEIRIDLPFDAAPVFGGFSSDAMDYQFPVIIRNLLGAQSYVGVAEFVDTVSFQSFFRIRGFSAYGTFDQDIADQVTTNTSFSIAGFDYYTDDDVPA